jgi:hypothetical protein
MNVYRPNKISTICQNVILLPYMIIKYEIVKNTKSKTANIEKYYFHKWSLEM